MNKVRIIYLKIFLLSSLYAVNVTFQVDMSTVSVNENGVHIVGSFQGWDPGSDELLSDNEDGIYSITIEMISGENHEYKYINGNTWDGEEFGFGVNREITVPDVDTVLSTVCFADISGNPCEGFNSEEFLSSLTFNADLSNAASNNGFELGDTLFIKWGYEGTQSSVNTSLMVPEILSFSYSITLDSIEVNLESGLFYQYYRLKNEEEFREIYFNFEYDNPNAPVAEKRYISFNDVINWDNVVINDNINSNVDSRRMPTFMNTDPIGQELTVTWTVDLRPAYYQVFSGTILEDIQGITDVSNADSVLSWGVWINGPASEPAGESWTSWGSALWNSLDKKMWDDGTHGDLVSNDTVYSVQFTYDENATIGQEFKFGIKGGDNESGYGLNHIANIDLSNPIVESYWGSINPLFYSAWDYDSNEPTLSISQIGEFTPTSFYLGDNFPNPFNPVTQFNIGIAEMTNIEITIFNLDGQLVNTVKKGKVFPGEYSVFWNGLNKNGIAVPTGIYIYNLHTDSGIRLSKKMTLIK